MKLYELLQITPGVTALIGGGVALCIAPVLRKALHK